MTLGRRAVLMRVLAVLWIPGPSGSGVEWLVGGGALDVRTSKSAGLQQSDCDAGGDWSVKELAGDVACHVN